MTLFKDMCIDFYRWITSKDVPRFDPVEFERQRADNPLIKQLEIDRAKHKRTRNEIVIVHNLSRQCAKVVLRYADKIPHKDFKFFMLYDGHTAFLPISIKPFLQPWDQVLLGLSQATITSI